jgi:hypothetical protein
VELGDGAVVETSTSFLQLRLDVREPAHVAGFGILGFWVRRGSYANRRRLRGVVSLSHAIASLEAGKSPGPWLIRHSGAVTDLGGYA